MKRGVKNPVKLARLKKNLTQIQLSEMSKVARSTIADIEKGIPARPTTLIRLAKALGVDKELFADLMLNYKKPKEVEFILTDDGDMIVAE